MRFGSVCSGIEDAEPRLALWSSGGGVQSAAIAALIVRGSLPVPDLAVIVDTERESSAVWEYNDSVIIPALAAVGCVLHRVPKSDFATVDLYGAGGKLLIPAFTNSSGSVGKLPTYCSTEWKSRVVRRYAESRLPKKTWSVWLGISVDEMRRCRQVEGKWQNRYPLIEQRMNRGDCIALVESMGWPAPPRSSCWMCPNRTNAEWLEMERSQPDDFAKAIALETEIRREDESLMLRDPSRDYDVSRCDSGFCFT